MAWPFDNKVDSVLPIDYGVQTIARNVNNALPNNRNNSGLQWWMNADRSRYPSPMRPDNLNPDLNLRPYQDIGAATVVDESRIPGRIQKELPTKKGFSFNPLNWGIMGMAKKMIEPNTPEENFGLKYFGDRNTLSSSGRTYGNQAYDVFAGKNVASAFGQGMGGAAQKRIDRINQTLSNWEAQAAEGDEEAIQRLKNTGLKRRRDEFKKQLTQYNKDLAAGTGGADIKGPVITKTTSQGTGDGPTRRDTSGWSSPGYTTRGGFTGTGGSPGTGQRGHHGNWAQGGRIGYRERGFVDPEEVDELSIFELMKDQGIDYDQMAEGVKHEFPSDALGAIDLNEEQMTIISDLNDKMETPDISLMSTISGAAEDAVERFITLLNTQSQAQGGSVGYFEGGLASLV